MTWLNHQLVFDTDDVIPACWPMHAHLIHELAVLADLRRRAERALTSDILDEWHRYALPSFPDRMRHRVGEHCNDQHAPLWPAAGRFTRHQDPTNSTNRRVVFLGDVMSLRTPSPAQELRVPALHLVDTDTGELLE